MTDDADIIAENPYIGRERAQEILSKLSFQRDESTLSLSVVGCLEVRATADICGALDVLGINWSARVVKGNQTTIYVKGRGNIERLAQAGASFEGSSLLCSKASVEAPSDSPGASR